MSLNSSVVDKTGGSVPATLSVLRPGDIALIEQALERVGDFGEVHLVVERGHLRFIRTVQSESVIRRDPRTKISPRDPLRGPGPFSENEG
jgi:hypothetical protein